MRDRLPGGVAVVITTATELFVLCLEVVMELIMCRRLCILVLLSSLARRYFDFACDDHNNNQRQSSVDS